MDILITGFMGAGKTTLIEGYAPNELGFSVYDLDHEVAHSLGLSEKNLGAWINEKGMVAFRQKEREILGKLLSKKESKVIALGGGTPCEGWFSETKGEALVVFLNTPFEVCLERIKGDPNRPMTLLGEKGLRDLYEKRLEHYQKADFTCSADEIKGIEALASLGHTLKD